MSKDPDQKPDVSVGSLKARRDIVVANYIETVVLGEGARDTDGSLTNKDMTPGRHPNTLFAHQVERSALFDNFLDLAQSRDIVFAVGGVGSGLKTFLDQFRQHLKRKSIRQYSAADLDLETFKLIRDARLERNELFRKLKQRQDDDQLDLKCLLASLAYATYHALREKFPAAIDKQIPAEYQEDPILFAEYYFSHSGAMLRGKLVPIIQYFFETIQELSEATECNPVIVFMPWRTLSSCFNRKSEPLLKKVVKDLWSALASLATEEPQGEGFGPAKLRLKPKKLHNRYDRVCVIIAGTRVPVGHKPFRTSLVSKSVWQIPPLDVDEVKHLLGQISTDLATDQIAEEVNDWTGGVPWFVRLLMSYLEDRQAVDGRRPSDQPPLGALDLLRSAAQGADAVLSGNPADLPGDLRDFVTQHIDTVRDKLTAGDAATDPLLVKRWSGPAHERNRGFEITSPRVEAWISSGLVWFKGSVWEANAEGHIFYEYPTVYFRRAGRLQISLYNAIADANLKHESD